MVTPFTTYRAVWEIFLGKIFWAAYTDESVRYVWSVVLGFVWVIPRGMSRVLFVVLSGSYRAVCVKGLARSVV